MLRPVTATPHNPGTNFYPRLSSTAVIVTVSRNKLQRKEFIWLTFSQSRSITKARTQGGDRGEESGARRSRQWSVASASVPACRAASPWIPSMDRDSASISQTSPFRPKWLLLVMTFIPVTAGKLGPLLLDFEAKNKIKF